MSAPTTPPTAAPPEELGAAAAIRLVATREFVERVRERAFLISTLVTLVVVLAVVLLPRLLFGGPTRYDVAVVGPSADALAEQLRATPRPDDVELEVTTATDGDAVTDRVRDGDLSAAVVGSEIVVDEELPGDLAPLLQQASRDVRVADGLGAYGVPADELPALLAPPPLEVRALTPGVAEAAGATEGLAFFATFILYGQLLGYGFTVAGGIVEEKSTRVVEVLLSTLKPTHLLAGKIIGVGAVGLAQLTLLAVIGLAVVAVTGVVDLPPGAPATIGMVFLWFLLGYVFYACVFGVAGSLVSRQEELGNVTTPLMLVVLVGFFGALGALEDPSSLLARVLTFLPPTAPMVMPVRVAFGAASVVEIVGAVVVTALGAAALIPLAARLYTGAVLRTGSRVKLGQAWRGEL